MASCHAEIDLVFDIRTDTARNVSIECRDPMIVRADILIINRSTRQLGAVVDGFMAELGLLSEDVINDFAGHSHATIGAKHFNGGFVSRTVPIVRS